VCLYQLVLAQTRLAVGSARCQQAHSANCVVAMVWISARRWYSLSTPSAVGGGEVLGSLATVVTRAAVVARSAVS
jgi:hypothetical protein